ncbi:MAG TPA: hypothetical protein VN829_24900, partial [Dongiaceae bacterium]|nr:hypothetical protein [Dongiaceae bacterium]
MKWTFNCGLVGSLLASAASFAPVAAAQPPAGTVVGWGERMMPQVPPGTRFQALAAGAYHSLALKEDGTVVAWGLNQFGGAQVPTGLSGVVAVAGGHYFSLALKQDGTVIGWGWTNYGQTTMPGLTGVVAIAAGYYHSLALKKDGTVAAWGAGGSGPIVDAIEPNYGQSKVPAGLSGVVAIAAGG